MYASTTVGHADLQVTAEFTVSRDGELDVTSILTTEDYDVSGHISESDLRGVENACWNAYDLYCADSNAEAAISRWESAQC